jgi:hypothetical protein
VVGFGDGKEIALLEIGGYGQSPRRVLQNNWAVLEPIPIPRRSWAIIGPSRRLMPWQTSASSAYPVSKFDVSTKWYSLLTPERVQTSVSAATKNVSPNAAAPLRRTKTALKVLVGGHFKIKVVCAANSDMCNNKSDSNKWTEEQTWQPVHSTALSMALIIASAVSSTKPRR